MGPVIFSLVQNPDFHGRKYSYVSTSYLDVNYSTSKEISNSTSLSFSAVSVAGPLLLQNPRVVTALENPSIPFGQYPNHVELFSSAYGVSEQTKFASRFSPSPIISWKFTNCPMQGTVGPDQLDVTWSLCWLIQPLFANISSCRALSLVCSLFSDCPCERIRFQAI